LKPRVSEICVSEERVSEIRANQGVGVCRRENKQEKISSSNMNVHGRVSTSQLEPLFSDHYCYSHENQVETSSKQVQT